MNNKLLKNRFGPAAAGILFLAFSSCSVFRPGTTSGSGNGGPGQPTPEKTNSGDNRFLNTISTDNPDLATGANDPDTKVVRSTAAENHTGKSPLYRSPGKAAARGEMPLTERTKTDNPAPLSVLQLKYSMLTNTPISKLDNQKLLEFMDEWYGVPYHFGGTSKKGIDCSAFTLNLMADVYGVTTLPRMSRDQYAASEKIPRKKLREGDLVFFHTYGKGKTVTHVGVYLYNNRFVHASVSGVQIDDLDGNYYSRHFVGAGRVLE